MAASLGALTVSLGLNAAEFTAGMTKAEFEAQKAAQKLKKQFDAIGAAVGVSAVAIGAFAVKLGKDFINAAADLDDMAEKTGASVEELSKLSQQAYISGVALETVEGALIQLSKHLQGSGEESKNTTRALAALGLKADDLKMLDTAQALKVVAGELNKFADGSGKSALAMDLLGKSGAQALPFLKDMANDAERAANVTREQAAAAEELGKAWRGITLDAKNVGQAMAMELIPKLKDLIEQFKIGKEVAGGFWGALRLSIQNNQDPVVKLNEIREKLEKLRTLQGELSKDTVANRINRNLPTILGGNDLVDIQRQISHLEEQKRFFTALATARGDKDNFDLFGTATKPLDYKASEDGSKKSEQAAERYRDMLVSLESQLRNVVGTETELQKLRAKIANDKDFASIPAKERERLRTALETAAAQIDLAKDQKEINKGWVAYAEAMLAADEATLTFNASLIKSPKELKALADGIKETLDPARKFVRVFKDYEDAIQQGLLTEADVWKTLLPEPVYLEDVRRLTDDVADASKDMGHAIGTAFEDAVLGGKKFGEMLQGLAQDIARIALRMMVTKPLESAVGNLLSGAMNAAFGGSTYSMAWSAPNSGAREGALLGSFATGTEYVPKTGPYLLHQGEQVTPANKTASEPIVYSPVYNFNGNAPNRSEVMQMINVGNAQTMRAIPDLMRRGGNFSRTVRGR